MYDHLFIELHVGRFDTSQIIIAARMFEMFKINAHFNSFLSKQTRRETQKMKKKLFVTQNRGLLENRKKFPAFVWFSLILQIFAVWKNGETWYYFWIFSSVQIYFLYFIHIFLNEKNLNFQLVEIFFFLFFFSAHIFSVAFSHRCALFTKSSL